MKYNAQAHIPTSQTISSGEMDTVDAPIAPIPTGSAVPGGFAENILIEGLVFSI